jgi:DNA-binding LacI/PurR family transcriptional regulator
VERLRGVEAALAPTQFDLVVFNVETPERRATVIRNLAHRARLDGLLILSLSPRAREVARIARAGIPTVLVDGNHRSMSRVVVDDVLGGRLAAHHLIELGHRRIGFLGEDVQTRFKYPPARLRRVGVMRELRSHGTELDPSHVRAGGFRETARRVAAELLAMEQPPTAVVCGSDIEALGVLEAARGAGIAVPGDLSVIGYDDIEIAGYLGLTTVRQPLVESGRRGVELLLAEMAGAETGIIREVLPLELVARATTGPSGGTRVLPPAAAHRGT